MARFARSPRNSGPASKPRSLSSRAAALAAPAALLLACAHTAPPPPLPAPPATVILSPGEITGIARAIRMEDRHALEPDTLRGLLASPSVEVRRRAALAAGRIGDTLAVPLLLPALRDGAAPVRADAAFALGLLRDSSAAVVRALAAAVETAPDAPATPAARAVTALGWSGGEAAYAAVAAVLARARGTRPQTGERDRRDAAPDAYRASRAAPPDSVLCAALLAVWRFHGQPGAAALVLPFARSEDRQVRWRAVYALMRIGGRAAAPALLDALRDPDPLVRSLAARGLRAAVADSAGIRPHAEAALRRAVADSAAQVVTNAIRALASYGDPALVPLLEPLLDGPDVNQAITAAGALGEIGGPAAVARLDATAARDSARLALRSAALAALVRIEPARGVARATRMAADSDWHARLYAARALAGAPWAAAAPLVRTLAGDGDARVVAAAVEAAGSILGDTIGPAYTFFLQELGSEDPIVRANALRGLQHRPMAADLGILLDAYARATTDTLDDAALAAVDALGALKRTGVPVARSFYLRFAASPDPLVRRAAWTQLGKGSWPPAWPARTGRTQADYEALVRRTIAPALLGAPPPRVRIRTAAGQIVLALAAADAPRTTENFLRLAAAHYFDGGAWHRVVPNFVIQDGDPRGDGNGGPGYAMRDEINPLPYDRGTLGMALAGPDTGGSQFFITHSPQPHLDGGYTVFGHVLRGMDVVDRVIQGDSIEAIEVIP